jgi:hypothetical protein
VQQLLPVQYHLLLVYNKVQASPIVSNVIVPVPEVCQPALVTVITMSPESAAMANTQPFAVGLLQRAS